MTSIVQYNIIIPFNPLHWRICTTVHWLILDSMTAWCLVGPILLIVTEGSAMESHENVLFLLDKKRVPWASYQIRNIAGCACAGNAGKVFPRRRFQRKPLVSDTGMHHGTCVTHVPWCMSGSLTWGDGENVPGISRACAPTILRIWQEAHVAVKKCLMFNGHIR